MRDLLPGIEIDLSTPGSPVTLFEGAAEIRLEIGFGGGEHLAHHARLRPQAGFIGCEPFRNGVAKFLERAATDNLDNVKLFIGDAGVLIERLPDAALAGVDLFYPDPWPKRRQRKRRFVSAPMLDRLARVMRPGAMLRFATDIDDYAGWTLARIAASDRFAWNAASADDWLEPWPDWPSTRYEAKALREGRRPVYLTFLRTDKPAPDPSAGLITRSGARRRRSA
jgi:tRNA (guanine-N7-)-methyltransferase